MERIKGIIQSTPVLGPACEQLYLLWSKLNFGESATYWEKRYARGGNSGEGSYDELARFKADYLNDFVKENDIKSVIEFGCGDGNQLSLANYPEYLGFDISSSAVKRCQSKFKDDSSKSFKEVNDYQQEQADLVLSLDVLYHLVEDETYETYMHRLLQAACCFIVIYSTNVSTQRKVQLPHVKHRKFTTWFEVNASGWKLVDHCKNPIQTLPVGCIDATTDFYVYKKK